MSVKPLNERQLFRMKRENLEKRIQQYYEETHDTDAVLEYNLAVLVFNAITMDDYSFVCQELIKEIFLTSEPSDKLRDYCLYFYDFFDYREWELVRARLFKNRAEFSEYTRLIRPETTCVRAASAPTDKARDWLLSVITVMGVIPIKRKKAATTISKPFLRMHRGKSINKNFKTPILACRLRS